MFRPVTQTQERAFVNHAVMTGPITGTVTLSDGTVVDVSPELIYVDTAEQRLEVADLIARRYVAEGHPAHTDELPFAYSEG